MKVTQALESWLTAIWYHKHPTNPLIKALLLLLSQIYRCIRTLTRQDTKIKQAKQAAKPVILVVGNLIAGGAGKTPIVCAVCHEMQKRGVQVGILSRGYKRKSQHPVIIHPNTTVHPKICGDEPAWLAQQTNCPIAVGSNRKQSLNLLTQQFPQLDLIVSDDGLQHHQLPRSLEWVVFDNRAAGNGLQIPAGPLREPLSRLQHVDAIVSSNLSTEALKSKLQLHQEMPPMFEAKLTLKGFVNHASQTFLPLHEALNKFSNKPLVAFTGLAHPDKFFKMLSDAGIEASERLVLPDHYSYPENYHETLTAKFALTTGKDAVKLSCNAKNIWVASIEIQLPNELIEQLLRRIKQPMDA